MKPPSILLAAESLAPGKGGICRVARLMARVLAGEAAAGRLRVSAVALSDDSVDPSLGIPVLACHGSRSRFVLQVQQAAWRHSHVVYDMAGMARAHSALRRLGKHFACWMHGVEIWEHARPDRINWCRHAGLLLANSAYTRGRAQRNHGGLAHAQVCWLATEQDETPPAPLVTPAPHVLILGRLAGSTQSDSMRYKGHEELIACWPEVVRRVPQARLLIGGEGPGREEIEALARSSGTAGAIEFLGFVPEEKTSSAFARARIFAMPSRGEGFGLVYVEAMRHGLPVIASCHDAAPEINLDGVTGYNVDLDQRGDLVSRIVELLAEPARARALGEAGRRRWVEHFQFSAFRRRFLALFNPWLAGGVAPGRAVRSLAETPLAASDG